MSDDAAGDHQPLAAAFELEAGRITLQVGTAGTGSTRLWYDPAGALRAIPPAIEFRPDWLWFDVLVDGERVGAAGLLFQDDGPTEVGYRIEAEHRRKGYATEALQGVVALAFGPLGEHEIAAQAAEDNVASHRTLMRLGFVEAGTAGPHWSERRGTYVNYRRYRLLRAAEGITP